MCHSKNIEELAWKKFQEIRQPSAAAPQRHKLGQPVCSPDQSIKAVCDKQGINSYRCPSVKCSERIYAWGNIHQTAMQNKILARLKTLLRWLIATIFVDVT